VATYQSASQRVQMIQGPGVAGDLVPVVRDVVVPVALVAGDAADAHADPEFAADGLHGGDDPGVVRRQDAVGEEGEGG
jgi:hypothetical protein